RADREAHDRAPDGGLRSRRELLPDPEPGRHPPLLLPRHRAPRHPGRGRRLLREGGRRGPRDRGRRRPIGRAVVGAQARLQGPRRPEGRAAARPGPVGCPAGEAVMARGGRMRRFRLIAWVLIAALLLDWAPLPEFLPDDVTQAAAQQPAVTVIGPGGTLYYSTASVLLSNVASAGTNIFSITIPGAMFATQSAANTTSTMGVGAPTLGPLNSSIPLHLQIAGLLDTGATPGTLNIGVNFGQGTTTNPTAANPFVATIALANAVTPTVSLVGTPFPLDVRLPP